MFFPIIDIEIEMGRVAEGLVVLIEANVTVCVCYWSERALTQFTGTEPERKTRTVVEKGCSLLIRNKQNDKTYRERQLWRQVFHSVSKMLKPK